MEIIDIYKHPKQENKTKQAKPPKWSKQNDRNETNLTTKTKRPKRSKKYTKNNGVNPGKMNGCHAGVSRHFLSFRLRPIPDLPHGKIQWSVKRWNAVYFKSNRRGFDNHEKNRLRTLRDSDNHSLTVSTGACCLCSGVDNVILLRNNLFLRQIVSYIFLLMASFFSKAKFTLFPLLTFWCIFIVANCQI